MLTLGHTKKLRLDLIFCGVFQTNYQKHLAAGEQRQGSWNRMKQLWMLVFDKKSTVHPVSEYQWGTLSVNQKEEEEEQDETSSL